MNMSGAIYTHYALHDKLDRIAPGIIFGLLLITRLIIHRQGYSSSWDLMTDSTKPIENDGENSKISNDKKID